MNVRFTGRLTENGRMKVELSMRSYVVRWDKDTSLWPCLREKKISKGYLQMFKN